MAARLIGSGFGISSGESDEPFDVDYNKLAEWLVSDLQSHGGFIDQQIICRLLKQVPTMQVEHKQLSSAWRKVLQAIQARMKAELGSLPASLQSEEGQATDYTAAKHIRDTLAETANKSILGGLKGTAGLWDKIVKAYQARSELI